MHRHARAQTHTHTHTHTRQELARCFPVMCRPLGEVFSVRPSLHLCSISLHLLATPLSIRHTNQTSSRRSIHVHQISVKEHVVSKRMSGEAGELHCRRACVFPRVFSNRTYVRTPNSYMYSTRFNGKPADRVVSIQSHTVPHGPMSPFITSLTSWQF